MGEMLHNQRRIQTWRMEMEEKLGQGRIGKGILVSNQARLMMKLNLTAFYRGRHFGKQPNQAHDEIDFNGFL